MRIAIVGTGVSGLVAAHHLHRNHEIVVYEAADWIGGHTHTVEVAEDDRSFAVDTGFIVFNHRNYPEFRRLLEELGVASHESNMSFGVNCERTGLEYRASSLDTLFAQRRNLLRPRIYRMIADIFRFFREAPALLASGDDSLTLGDYLTSRGYSEVFIEKHIFPMGAALWSATRQGIRGFPARYFVRFLDNHGMLARDGRPVWRVVSGGSQRYVDSLVRPFADRIRLRTPVRSIRRDPERVWIETDAESPESFDHVVVATHSDQALRLLAEPSDLERRVLSTIPYQANEVVLHTDTTILPRRRKAWAAWNHHILDDDRDSVAVTYWMNLLQGLDARREYLVTLNATERIDPSKVLARYVYHHPVFTPEGVALQPLQTELGRDLRTSFCGAYWGFGFHEDGVRSALRAVRTLPVGSRTALPAEART